MNKTSTACSQGATEIDLTAQMATKHHFANEALSGGKLGSMSFIAMMDLSLRA
jgi:hypothetical protein